MYIMYNNDLQIYFALLIHSLNSTWMEHLCTEMYTLHRTKGRCLALFKNIVRYPAPYCHCFKVFHEVLQRVIYKLELNNICECLINKLSLSSSNEIRTLHSTV